MIIHRWMICMTLIIFLLHLHFTSGQRISGSWAEVTTIVPLNSLQPTAIIQDTTNVHHWYFAGASLVRVDARTPVSMVSLVHPSNISSIETILQDPNTGKLYFLDSGLPRYINDPLGGEQIPKPAVSRHECPRAISMYLLEPYIYYLCRTEFGVPPFDARVLRVNISNPVGNVTVLLTSECAQPSSIQYDQVTNSLLIACHVQGIYIWPLTPGVAPRSIVMGVDLCDGVLDMFYHPTTRQLIVQCYSVGIILYDEVNPENSGVLIGLGSNECYEAAGMFLDATSGTVFVTCPFSNSGGVIALQLVNGTNAPIITTVVSSELCSAASVAVMDRVTRAILASCASGVVFSRGRSISSVVPMAQCPNLVDVKVISESGALITQCDDAIKTMDGAEISNWKIPPKTICNGILEMERNPITGYLYYVCVLSADPPYTPEYHVYMQENSTSPHQFLFNWTDEAPYIFTSLDSSDIFVMIEYGYDGRRVNRWNPDLRILEPVFESANVCLEPTSLFGMLGRLYCICYGVGVVSIPYSNLTSPYTLHVNATECPTNYALTGDPATGGMWIGCRTTQPAGDPVSALLYYNVLTNTSWPVPNGTPSCTNVKYDAGHKLVWMLCQGTVIVFDMKTNTTIPNAVTAECLTPLSLSVDDVAGVVYVACAGGSVLGFSSEFSCMSGYSWSADRCLPCATSSARGQIAREAALRSVPQCQACKPGSIASLPGSSKCTACPQGRYADDSLGQVCSACLPGQHQNTSGNTACMDCPVGKFSAGVLAIKCDPCAPGSHASQTGAVGCLFCQPGSDNDEYQDLSGQSICKKCAPGRFSTDIGYQECPYCGPGSYSSAPKSTICTQCSRGSASNVTGLDHACPDCPIGYEQINFGETRCFPCWLGYFAQSGDSCQLCPANSYAPFRGAPCVSCTQPGQEGLECTNGLASVRNGFWAYLVHDDETGLEIFHTTRCPEGFCAGGILQDRNTSIIGNGTSFSQSAVTYCAWPRLNSPSNWLCSDCVEGHEAWGDECVACTGVNGGLVFALLVFCFLVALVLLYSGTKSPYMAIFLFFCQSAALMLGPISQYLDWIQIINLSAESTKACIAPLTPLEQKLVTLLSPFILVACLAVVGVVRYMLHLIYRGTTSIFAPFSFPRYIGCTMSILLFCYTPVTVAVVQSLNCVEIAPGQKLLFSAPTVDCNSDDYAHHFPITILFLSVYVLAFPIVIVVCLWTLRDKLYIKPEGVADATEKQILTTFQKHWGPLYLLYVPRAWFWQPLVLLRRFFFALTAVLIRNADDTKYSIFAFLSFVSLLLHLQFSPYERARMNFVESVSYTLLIFISLILAASSAPFPVYVQVILFFLIVPPALGLFVWTALAQYRRLRARIGRRKTILRESVASGVSPSKKLEELDDMDDSIAPEASPSRVVILPDDNAPSDAPTNDMVRRRSDLELVAMPTLSDHQQDVSGQETEL